MTTRDWIGAMVIMAAAALPASAQEAGTTDHISVEMDAGFLSDYDDSGLWEQGYIAGVAGLWSLNASTALCVRFGISHWSYVPDSVVLDLVPPSAELTFQQSSGQIEVLALTPMIRWNREDVLPWRLGAFAEGGVGVAYVKAFALTEVAYGVGGPTTGTARFEIDEADIRAELVVAAGLTHPLSSSSWLEVIPVCHVIFAAETADVFGISVGFRVRV